MKLAGLDTYKFDKSKWLRLEFGVRRNQKTGSLEVDKPKKKGKKMTHDYGAVLDVYMGAFERSGEWFCNEQHEAIIQALRIADALLQEPSEAMIKEGNNASGWVIRDADDVFKAMRDQLLKECGE